MKLFIPFLLAALTSSSAFADQEHSYSTPPPSRIAASPSPADAPLKPSIAVAIAILTTTFFVIFLILLYLKHCKQGNSYTTGYYNHAEPSNDDRKNSGINRLVIESLPVFRFKSLRGQHKDGLECAVCLNKFEASELLRLLPKCKHAFHVECVDTWLDAHSTCPLCRYRVHPEDILLMGHAEHSQRGSTQDGEKHEDIAPRRVSGRHSYAGERRESNPVSVSQNRHSLDTMTSKVSSKVVNLARKDGLLLSGKTRKLDHKINIVWSETGTETEVSGPTYAQQERWSDVHISDLMYVRPRYMHGNHNNCDNYHNNDGRNVINDRSASEITGVSRFSSSGINIIRYGQRQEGREAGVLSRWLSWIYPNTTSAHSSSVLSHSQPAVSMVGP